jgi:hypothetical protein
VRDRVQSQLHVERSEGKKLEHIALDLYHLWQFYTTFGLGAAHPGRLVEGHWLALLAMLC